MIYRNFLQLGMGSALETLCGQAFGAKQLPILGVYMQRSYWATYPHYNVCLSAAHLLVCEPPPSVTKLGQEDLHACWKFFIVHDLPALRIRIQFSDTKALAGQSKIMTMAIVSAVAMVFHIFLSWLPMVHFKLGLMGAAASLNLARWIVVPGYFAYIAMGCCTGAWTGFSWGAFRDLGLFAKLSIS